MLIVGVIHCQVGLPSVLSVGSKCISNLRQYVIVLIKGACALIVVQYASGGIIIHIVEHIGLIARSIVTLYACIADIIFLRLAEPSYILSLTSAVGQFGPYIIRAGPQRI